MITVEDLISLVLKNAPPHPGRETPLSYLLLNLLVPLFFAPVLAWVTHRLEKLLSRLIREKR